jgi:hypothetical protein
VAVIRAGSHQQMQETFAAISDVYRDADVICALLECYAASCGNPLPTFRDNVPVPYSRVKKSTSFGLLDFLNIVPICCTETSIKDYQTTLRNIPEERRPQETLA